MRANREFLLKHPAHLIAFGFGAGLIPKAPGTWGTLVAIPFYFLALRLGGTPMVLACAFAFFFIGIWASSVTGRNLGVADYGGIVVDEIAAFVLVLAFTPAGLNWLVVAFVLFRIFDIVKPWPISYFDRTLKGGFGVMFDDLLAALGTIALLLILHSFVWEFSL
ncbi:MAG: phosphatidylglycerophosphatase A [Betaproteobacteria bacterium]